jgi:hypothetical protein
MRVGEMLHYLEALEPDAELSNFRIVDGKLAADVSCPRAPFVEAAREGRVISASLVFQVLKAQSLADATSNPALAYDLATNGFALLPGHPDSERLAFAALADLADRYRAAQADSTAWLVRNRELLAKVADLEVALRAAEGLINRREAELREARLRWTQRLARWVKATASRVRQALRRDPHCCGCGCND